MPLTIDANLLVGAQYGFGLGALVGLVLGALFYHLGRRRQNVLIVQTFLAENVKSGGKALEAVIAKDFLEKGPYYQALQAQKGEGMSR